LNECTSAEEFVAYCARVSNPANQNNTQSADKLLRYLIKHKHWSPFEMVHVVIEINTTRDIGRQILRHRSFSFQEFSQRYAIATQFVTREARLQDTKNRQNSIRTDDTGLQRRWYYAQRAVQWLSERVYKWALKAGVAKEQARAVLPEGMTATRMYMSGTLRSWIHYCDLRCANGTQLEHMEVALAAKEALREQFPNVILAIGGE
jgi:thymidylate synthase (FAD)